MNSTKKMAVIAVLAASAADAASAASGFEGTWKVTDNAGKGYEITLAPGGKATGTQESGQEGTWQSDGSGVTITWKSGWVTKIAKDGDKYSKTASDADGKAGAATPAEKVK